MNHSTTKPQLLNINSLKNFLLLVSITFVLAISVLVFVYRSANDGDTASNLATFPTRKTNIDSLISIEQDLIKLTRQGSNRQQSLNPKITPDKSNTITFTTFSVFEDNQIQELDNRDPKGLRAQILADILGISEPKLVKTTFAKIF